KFTIQQGDIVTFSTPLPAVLSRSAESSSSADSTSAKFDPKTNQLIELVQTRHFKFSEGTREGNADKATFKDGGNTIILSGSPSVSDPQMTLKAQQIDLNQKDNSFIATGKVFTKSRAAQGEQVFVEAAHAEGNGD